MALHSLVLLLSKSYHDFCLHKEMCKIYFVHNRPCFLHVMKFIHIGRTAAMVGIFFFLIIL